MERNVQKGALLLLAIFAGAASEAFAPPPQVCIADGCLVGKFMDGLRAGPFEAFLGIPFASPPVGKLRFANPVPNEPWDGNNAREVGARGLPYDASSEKSACVQKNDLIPNAKVEGSEDCLYLNVYRPKGQQTSAGYKNAADLPVMVYIHGGGYFAGSATPAVLGPEYFMDTKRVILVVIQYRLGVFGFLSTGDDEAPGNVGLKDQVMALQWVQKNIRCFGGDPKLVTIFGQSAGAGSVHMHMISPMSKGLFSRAIPMSGNALAPWNIPTAEPLELARKQAEAVGVRNAKELRSEEIVDALRSIDADAIAGSIDKLKGWSIDPLTLYRPVIEQSKSKQQSFLVEDPRVSWQNGRFQQIPWMTGTVPNEGAVRATAILANDVLLNQLNRNITHLLPFLLEKDSSDELLARIKARFFSGRPDGQWISKENGQRFIDMYTEAGFIYPYQAAVKQYVTIANTNLAPVSVYKFSFRGRHSYSLFYTASLEDYGVVHCDDLLYLFRSPALFPDFPPKSDEARMARYFVNFFIDFAINGVATTPLAPYQPCTDSNKVTLSMDCDVLEFINGENEDQPFDVRIIPGLDEDLFAFWKDLY
ncbi:juvenile hormone esterase-like isoform X2 [Uranotaenia lowii]|uniref:juvenile hormone esterase-like isoform X2 n=1 Tax=Uranotaenia lowii TaxID=190385 RepID=UPI0024796E58|nr:juvenile hormone esterase-like isoform X2 [Uranotaenia lowii]